MTVTATPGLAVTIARSGGTALMLVAGLGSATFKMGNMKSTCICNTCKVEARITMQQRTIISLLRQPRNNNYFSGKHGGIYEN
jgi:hypothetical protein